MGYYAQIMIELKERFGHILKERGLVMRGERIGGELNLVFKSEDGAWRLPVEIEIPGSDDTGKPRAEWEDLKVSALIHSEVKIGKDGWVGFVERQNETLERSDCKSASQFTSAIGTYLKDCVIIPNVLLEREVAPEIAAAYFEFAEGFGVSSEDIEFTVGDGVQTVTAHDAAGQAVSFVWSRGSRYGKVLVDGICVEQTNAFDYTDIANTISEHFEQRTRRRSR